MVRFEELADQLDEVALHLRLEDREYQANQYRLASDRLRRAEFIPANPAEIDEIGESIRDDIAEYRAFGEIPRLRDMREKRPYLAELTRVSGLGPKTAKRLYHEKDIETIDELIELADNDELTDVTGIGSKTEAKLMRSARQLDQNA